MATTDKHTAPQAPVAGADPRADGWVKLAERLDAVNNKLADSADGAITLEDVTYVDDAVRALRDAAEANHGLRVAQLVNLREIADLRDERVAAAARGAEGEQLRDMLHHIASATRGLVREDKTRGYDAQRRRQDARTRLVEVAREVLCRFDALAPRPSAGPAPKTPAFPCDARPGVLCEEPDMCGPRGCAILARQSATAAGAASEVVEREVARIKARGRASDDPAQEVECPRCHARPGDACYWRGRRAPHPERAALCRANRSEVPNE